MNTKKSFFNWYLSINLLLKITIAIVMGSIVGVLLIVLEVDAESYIDIVSPLGDVLIRLLKMIVIPVVSLSLIVGAASLAPSKLGSVGIKILVIYFVTNAVAVFLGLLFANIFKPGLGMNLVSDITTVITVKPPQSMVQVFLNIIPTNLIESLVKGDILPIIFFSFLFGISIAILKEKKVKGAQVLLEVLEGAVEAIYVIVGGVMQYAPIGVFALISIVFAIHGAKVLGPLLFVIVVCYITYTVQLFLVFGGMLAMNKLNIVVFFKKTTQAFITAFVTRSSSGTLPVSMNSMENLGVPRAISSFTLPLGATINMNGTGIYLGICAMFVGYATNTPLTIEQQITTVITASLAAIGTAGIPGAGAIMLLLVFETIGFKFTEGSAIATAYAMILGIDTILDMGRTSLNVGGDMVCTAIITKSENELDEMKWR